MNTLRIEHQTGMYGNCKDINAYTDELFFGHAHFSAGERIWYVIVYNKDGSPENYDIHHCDGGAGSVAQVDAIIRMAHRSNYATKVAA